MDSIIDHNVPKEVAMTSLDWCARSRQLSLLNDVLAAHFSNSAISDMERECSLVLRNAVSSGCKDTVMSLLRHVDDAFLHRQVEGDVKEGRTMLEKLLGLAVQCGHSEVAETLLLKGANPNSCYHSKPLLHLSLTLGHTHLAPVLMHFGADVNFSDSKGETAIFAVLSSDSVEKNSIVNLLITNGADLNHQSATGRQPIHCAALASSPRATISRLAEAGCDVNARDRVLEDTPLHLACARCSKEAVAELLRQGARMNEVNAQGDTPLRKLLQHVTRGSSRDFHQNSRTQLARLLVNVGFRLAPPTSFTFGYAESRVSSRATKPKAAEEVGVIKEESKGPLKLTFTNVLQSEHDSNGMNRPKSGSVSSNDRLGRQIFTNFDSGMTRTISSPKFSTSSQVMLGKIATSKLVLGRKASSCNYSHYKPPFDLLVDSLESPTEVNASSNKKIDESLSLSTLSFTLLLESLDNIDDREEHGVSTDQAVRRSHKAETHNNTLVTERGPVRAEYDNRGMQASEKLFGHDISRRGLITTTDPISEKGGNGLRPQPCETRGFITEETAGSTTPNSVASVCGPRRKAYRAAKRDKVVELMATLMKEERTGRVASLQHLCRLVVRNRLPGVRFQQRVNSELELSPQMRQYLMFLPSVVDDTV